jgi:hypothetical protein
VGAHHCCAALEPGSAVSAASASADKVFAGPSDELSILSSCESPCESPCFSHIVEFRSPWLAPLEGANNLSDVPRFNFFGSLGVAGDAAKPPSSAFFVFRALTALNLATIRMAKVRAMLLFQVHSTYSCDHTARGSPTLRWRHRVSKDLLQQSVFSLPLRLGRAVGFKG